MRKMRLREFATICARSHSWKVLELEQALGLTSESKPQTGWHRLSSYPKTAERNKDGDFPCFCSITAGGACSLPHHTNIYRRGARSAYFSINKRHGGLFLACFCFISVAQDYPKPTDRETQFSALRSPVNRIIIRNHHLSTFLGTLNRARALPKHGPCFCKPSAAATLEFNLSSLLEQLSNMRTVQCIQMENGLFFIN